MTPHMGETLFRIMTSLQGMYIAAMIQLACWSTATPAAIHGPAFSPQKSLSWYTGCQVAGQRP
eukprot:scaffold320542_cov24-Prasinocladus_malaysianus.AAC.1